MKLEIKNLSKHYGNVTALDQVSVTFEQGIYGVLGANGAGKSTLVNLITDNVRRDAGESGEILYDGVDILKLGADFRGIIGYMPQQQGFYDEFTAKEFLKYMANIKGIYGRAANEQIDTLLEIVNLTSAAYKKVGGFSGGMKQRVLLAQALLGNPKILILDEPTAGLDPKERIHIRNYIASLEKDKIILYATHVISDIECIASRVMLIKNGRVLCVEKPAVLLESLRGKVGELICSPEEMEKIKSTYPHCNINQRANGLALRIVSDTLPEAAELQTDNIGLEDVFLYYLAN